MRGRRDFLRLSARLAMAAATGGLAAACEAASLSRGRDGDDEGDTIRLFLCGDVMLGRGIDQILPHPSDPVLYEEYVKDARGYLVLAERAHGAIRRPVAPAYPWGDALAELERRRPHARIINLETSVTRSDTPWPGKPIHYRMHPANIACLAAARPDCCVLGNNHVLDWGHAGLAETLATIRGVRIATAGAGADLAEAQAPAALPVGEGARVLVFSAGCDDAGVAPSWAATADRAGVHRLPDLSASTVATVAALVARHRRPGDIVVFSIHWGGNWGYDIKPAHRAFAHALVDEAGVDVVHGHSSHHAKAIEVHGGRLVLYGCGDFLNDYEGIESRNGFRDEVGAMYFASVARADGRLLGLEMVPTRIRRLRVNRARGDDASWLRDTLRRECRRFGGDIVEGDRHALALQW
jgi:poly-gamma-glutamate synthesis protein (capsule biosynthesis protein)